MKVAQLKFYRLINLLFLKSEEAAPFLVFLLRGSGQSLGAGGAGRGGVGVRVDARDPAVHFGVVVGLEEEIATVLELQSENVFLLLVVSSDGSCGSIQLERSFAPKSLIGRVLGRFGVFVERELATSQY